MACIDGREELLFHVSRIVIGINDRRLCRGQLSVDDRLLRLVIDKRVRWHYSRVCHVWITLWLVRVDWI